jgi:hypothetical protein
MVLTNTATYVCVVHTAPAVKRFKAKASKPVTQSAPTSDSVAGSNTAGESAAAGVSVSQAEAVDGPHKYSRHLLSAASPMITRGVHASGFRWVDTVSVQCCKWRNNPVFLNRCKYIEFR